MLTWNQFRREMAGQGYTPQELSQLYNQHKRQIAEERTRVPQLPKDIYLYSILGSLPIDRILDFARSQKQYASIVRDEKFWTEYFRNHPEMIDEVAKTNSPWLLKIFLTLNPDVEVFLNPIFKYRSFNLLPIILESNGDLERSAELIAPIPSKNLEYTDDEYRLLAEILGPKIKEINQDPELRKILTQHGFLDISPKNILFFLNLGWPVVCHDLAFHFRKLSSISWRDYFPNKNLHLKIFDRLFEGCAKQMETVTFNYIVTPTTLHWILEEGFGYEHVIDYFSLFPRQIMNLEREYPGSIKLLKDKLPNSYQPRLRGVFLYLIGEMEKALEELPELIQNRQPGEHIIFPIYGFFQKRPYLLKLMDTDLRKRSSTLISETGRLLAGR